MYIKVNCFLPVLSCVISQERGCESRAIIGTATDTWCDWYTTEI